MGDAAGVGRAQRKERRARLISWPLGRYAKTRRQLEVGLQLMARLAR